MWANAQPGGSPHRGRLRAFVQGLWTVCRPQPGMSTAHLAPPPPGSLVLQSTFTPPTARSPAPRSSSPGTSRRLLPRSDQTMPPPPHRPQPRPGPANRRRHPCGRRWRPKPVEPPRRGAGIQGPPVPRPVLPEIHQHVDQPVPDLPRRPQRPHMVPIPPDRSRSPQRAVDRPRQPDREPPRPAPQPRLIRLDDEMHVVPLHRKLHDPKRLRARRPDRLPHRPEHPTATQ
jgi:hypothetical protein